ncbi:MAG TPA: uracil-DNA glycosylase [Candidatus Dormibacteraeota bacterium]
MDAFVHNLAAARIGATFNQYCEGGAADRDPATAAAVRRANLRAYLRAHAQAPVVAVAEAAGWRGARYSGIPLLSERLIDDAAGPYRRTSTAPGGFAEASASIVQEVLRAGGWVDAVLLWNVVPTHPAGSTPHSNRALRSAEVVAGQEFLLLLLDLVRPRHLVAIGRTAAAALPPGLGAVEVRHPAHGGATQCRTALKSLLCAWLGPRVAEVA